MLGKTTEETIALMRAQGVSSGRLSGQALVDLCRNEDISADVESLTRATATQLSTNSDLVAYDLQPVTRWLVPQQLPLVETVARIGGGTGVATHWKAVSKVNASRNSSGVAEGARNAFDSFDTRNHLATYKTLGRETYVTKELEEASKGFDDANAVAAFGLLLNMRREEERCFLGSNNTVLLGKPATPTIAEVLGGGAIADGATVKVYVVPLTNQGMVTAGFTGLASATSDILTYVTTTMADATSRSNGGYCGRLSDVATVTLTSPGSNDGAVSAYTADIKGAVGYAWFWGPTTTTGSKLGAVTTVNHILIKSAVGLSAVANMDANNSLLTDGADHSTNAYEYDGLLSLLMGVGQVESASDSGAYYNSLATGTPGTGTTLTFDGAAGCKELDAMIEGIYANSRFAPSRLLVSTQGVKDIAKGILGGGAAPLFRFNVDVSGSANQDQAMKAVAQGQIAAGAVVVSYLSKLGYTGPEGIKIEVHPDLAAGVIIGMRDTLPYPQAGVSNSLYYKYRTDYYQIAWPLRTRRRETGVYTSGVLALAFGPGFGVIKNIAPVA